MSHPSERQVAVSASKLLINNRWIANESDKTFATIDPATGAEICQVSEADAASLYTEVKTVTSKLFEDTRELRLRFARDKRSAPWCALERLEKQALNEEK